MAAGFEMIFDKKVEPSETSNGGPQEGKSQQGVTYDKSAIEQKLEATFGTKHLGLLGVGGLNRVSLVEYPSKFKILEVAMRYPTDAASKKFKKNVQKKLERSQDEYNLQLALWWGGAQVCFPFDYQEVSIGDLTLPVSFQEVFGKPGRNAYSLLKIAGRLDAKLSLDIAVDLAEALCLLDDQGAVHRDIKPGNILFNEQAEAKLIDFGSFGFAGVPDEGYSIMGTPQYIDPFYNNTAMNLGRGNFDYSDQFQLLLVLYEFLEDRRPFNQNAQSANQCLHDMVNNVTTKDDEKNKNYLPPTARDAKDTEMVKALHPIFDRGFNFMGPDRHPSIHHLYDELMGVHEKYVVPYLDEVQASREELAAKVFPRLR